MFVDFSNQWSMPERPDRTPPRPRITRRQERTIAWILGINLAMLVLGPFAGATIFDAVAAMLHG